jgi:hypothetical protein
MHVASDPSSDFWSELEKRYRELSIGDLPWTQEQPVLGTFLAIVPATLWRVARLPHAELILGFSLLWLLLTYKAHDNEEFKLPVIGDLAAKQA